MSADSVFAVTVSGCTPEQAAQVMGERLNHDEDYGFEYEVGFEPMEPVAEPTYPLPSLSMDVTGHYVGDAYPHEADYRVRLKEQQHVYHLIVEDSGGIRVGEMVLDWSLVDGIKRMASTDHSLSGYEDDWTIPDGMGRTLVWTLPTEGSNHYVELDDGQIDQIAAWLEYATGEKVWDGGEVWEF